MGLGIKRRNPQTLENLKEEDFVIGQTNNAGTRFHKMYYVVINASIYYLYPDATIHNGCTDEGENGYYKTREDAQDAIQKYLFVSGN